jgi:alpha-glucosidase
VTCTRQDGELRSLAWWQREAIYQVYPRSFQDSDGDGIGDLPGLLSRMDYLAWLGVGAVWLSPLYRSPMLDFGYDIADFTSVDPLFGTLADFDRVLAGLHERGIRLVLDFVPNHTSDQHQWFIEARSSRADPKRDWYVWSDPAGDGGPPNNWLSRFGGSAWEWDETTGQFYYHAFLKEQPDLNWRNPEVRRAMADVLRFWLQRGVDGFRVDASAVLIEDALLRDDPPNPDFDQEHMPPPERLTRRFTDGRPETLECLAEFRQVIDAFTDRVLLGEVQGDTERIARFYSSDHQKLLHLPLNFLLLDTPWDAVSMQAAIDAYVQVVPPDAWPDWILGSHDKSRIATRVGSAQARLAAMLLMTLRGTPVFYAGDEIGMPDIEVAPEQVQDPFERLVPGYGLNRDPERAPMRWDGTRNAGFTTGKPWLPICPELKCRNVAAQSADERSILNLYRRLLALRRSEPALVGGDYEPVRNQNSVFAFCRRLGDSHLLIVLNMKNVACAFAFGARAEVLLSTTSLNQCQRVETSFQLQADEGVILKVEQTPSESAMR